MVATHGPDNVNVRVSLTGLTDGEDYDADIRYGDCTMAAMYLIDEDAAEDAAEEMQDSMNLEHTPGDKIADIDLTTTGMTATGTAEVDSNKLRAGEAAYLVIKHDDALMACSDLRGHDMGGMGAGMPAMPADSTHR